MRRVRVSSALLILFGAATSGVVIAIGCQAAGERSSLGPDDPGPGGGGGAGDGGGGAQVASSGAIAPEEGFGGLVLYDAGAGAADVAINPCGTECGPEELCDRAHLGLDDDCDGEVDETCDCISGQAHSCFMGDPSYRTATGCFPGTALCSETGIWGPCVGGRHATEKCFEDNPVGCHALQAPPFTDVNLKEGTGSFSADAVPGTESWAVACPAGIDPCPGVTGTDPPDDFKPLQSGEYTVTYTKQLADGTTASCEYPLYVGAPGLRVELEWEHDLGGSGVDLDLHVHRPNDTQPWRVSGSSVDCGYNNCTIHHLRSNSSLNWFSDTATPPDPVSWYLHPVEANNTCYFAPRGVGQMWRNHARGCHSPRLDLDNVTCNPTSTDPNTGDFCAPENVNIDFPPMGEWTRIGVHYYSSHGLDYTVHPRIKIFCNGALGADLGPTGFYDPEAPVEFAPGDGGSLYWLVADVAFVDGGECGEDTCVVRPLYQDEVLKTPLLTTRDFVESNFGPGYLPAP